MEYNKTKTILKKYRNKKNMTQGDLGKYLKVHTQFVSNWERGKCLPPDKVMSIILKSIDTTEFLQLYAADMIEHYKKRVGVK
jgi:DNA-binding transcriptional regulator YiaG